MFKTLNWHFRSCWSLYRQVSKLSFITIFFLSFLLPFWLHFHKSKMTLSECYIHMLLIIYSLFCLVHGFIIVRYLSYEFVSLPIDRRCQLLFLMHGTLDYSCCTSRCVVRWFTVLMLDQRMNVTISLFLFSIFKIDHSFTHHL